MANNQPTNTSAEKPKRFTTSLVLGSGGARGYAHIGVIEELVEQGIDIRSIAGCSMGALIGGMYASDKLKAYSDWVKPLQKFSVLRLLDWTFSGGGLIKGERLSGVLKELIGDIKIEQLPISYTAVAVDLNTQREVWFSRGPLFDAIRASIAIPTLFRPHRYQGRMLVDGGLLNPVPVSPTLRDLTDCTIAVDVNAPAEPLSGAGTPIVATPNERTAAAIDNAKYTKRDVSAEPNSDEIGSVYSIEAEPVTVNYREKLTDFFGSLFEKQEQPNIIPELSLVELFGRSLDTVQETITRLKLAAQPPDLLITIPRNSCAFYEFHRAEELIEVGRQRTRQALARWQRSF